MAWPTLSSDPYPVENIWKITDINVLVGKLVTVTDLLQKM